MIFARGKLLPDDQLSALLVGLEEEINTTRAALNLEAETVINAIDALGQKLDRGELNHLLAQFATPKMLEGLEQIRPSLTREALELKLHTELGPDWASLHQRPFGHTRMAPLGTLFHVTAGNVEGLPAFSAVEGLLTGNVNLIKLPREDKGLTPALLSLLVEEEPRLAPFLYAFDFPSNNVLAMSILARMSDGLVVWGGEQAVATCRRLAPPGCKLMEWGHRLSFAYIAGFENRETELTELARHIVHTGGLLCSSCQVIFLDTEDMAQAGAFCQHFLPFLEHAARENRSLGQRGQSALYAREAFLEHVTDRKDRDARFFPGRGCSVTLGAARELELSPLHGNVLVKCLPRKELLLALRRQKGRLQTAGLLCPPEERAALTDLLARAGLTRITRAGSLSNTFPGEGHDGEYPLRRYLRAVDIEK